MTTNEINIAAAQSLIRRALESTKQSESNLLISAAKSLDPSTNTEQLKAAWLEKWLLQNRNRKGNL